MQITQSFLVKAFILVIICEIIGFTAGIGTAEGVTNWFQTIEKPFFNPPSWIFAPVWTMLYALMGISAALVWQQGIEKKEVQQGLILFGIQLVLNFFWSFIFFKFHLLFIAFLEISILLIFIILTTIQFYKIDKTAGLLMIPYILWVSFASLLNFSLWWLNQ